MEIAAIEASNGPGKRLEKPESFETVFDGIINEMEAGGIVESKTEPATGHDRPGTTLRTFYTIPIAALAMQNTYIPKEMLPEAFDEMQQAYVYIFDEMLDLRGFISLNGFKEKYRDYLKMVRGQEWRTMPGDTAAWRWVKRSP